MICLSLDSMRAEHSSGCYHHRTKSALSTHRAYQILCLRHNPQLLSGPSGSWCEVQTSEIIRYANERRGRVREALLVAKPCLHASQGQGLRLRCVFWQCSHLQSSDRCLTAYGVIMTRLRGRVTFWARIEVKSADRLRNQKVSPAKILSPGEH